MRQLGRSNAKFELIGEGDRVAVALSGGKDSLTLLHALCEQRRRAPFSFEIIAVTIGYGMGEDFTHLIGHCKEHDIKHVLRDSSIYETSKDKIRKNSSFCSFFSRMRRGYLYSVAEELGCNKLALGHHLDDAVESFFMNMIYNGQLRSMSPKYLSDRGIMVIRPLIELRERQLRACADENGWQVIGDEACPAMRFDIKMPHARATMKNMLADMEDQYPDIFQSIRASFGNISDESFFDKERFRVS